MLQKIARMTSSSTTWNLASVKSSMFQFSRKWTEKANKLTKQTQQKVATFIATKSNRGQTPAQSSEEPPDNQQQQQRKDQHPGGETIGGPNSPPGVKIKRQRDSIPRDTPHSSDSFEDISLEDQNYASRAYRVGEDQTLEEVMDYRA